MTTHTLTLDLKRPPLTSNDQRRAHWTKVRNAKTHVALLVQTAARRHKTPQIASCAVRVTWYAPDARRRDADSLGPLLKASLDALVHIGVLTDDCAPHVLETTTCVVVDRANPRIEIQLEERP